MFDAKLVRDKCVQWIRDWFEKNSNVGHAIVGISGGKDSTVVAALCVEALGKHRVYGILMPNGEQEDINISRKVVDYLGIDSFEINIADTVNAVYNSINSSIWRYPSDVTKADRIYQNEGYVIEDQTKINLPARIRMATLYAFSQSWNGRVANTCNKSEDWVGYATKYGDAAGDFSPLSNLLVREVKAIGYELGLPAEFIEKVPSDGLCGKTDEENLGFTYEMLDAYIGDGIEPPAKIKEKIDKLHKQNLFKLQPMAAFDPYISKSAD